MVKKNNAPVRLCCRCQHRVNYIDGAIRSPTLGCRELTEQVISCFYFYPSFPIAMTAVKPVRSKEIRGILSWLHPDETGSKIQCNDFEFRECKIKQGYVMWVEPKLSIRIKPTIKKSLIVRKDKTTKNGK
jgi:hypothetical protein